MPAKVTITEKSNTDALLARLPIALRGKYVKQGLRAAGKVVATPAKALCPKGGYAGDKPGKTPLSETLAVQLRDYGERQVAVVGPSFPEGAHGHLVEFGHELVIDGKSAGHVPPHPFLRPAADTTISQQKQALETAILKGIESEAKKG